MSESIAEYRDDGHEVRAVLCFDAGLSVFEGHFPDRPLVPGVYLLEAARQLGERLHGGPLGLASVDDARFTAPVAPGARVEVSLRLDGQSVDARRPAEAHFHVDGEEAATLRLSLGVPAAEAAS